MSSAGSLQARQEAAEATQAGFPSAAATGGGGAAAASSAPVPAQLPAPSSINDLPDGLLGRILELAVEAALG